MYFFSAARKGVQSASIFSGLFLVDFQYFLRAFLYAALVGSCIPPLTVVVVAVVAVMMKVEKEQ